LGKQGVAEEEKTIGHRQAEKNSAKAKMMDTQDDVDKWKCWEIRRSADLKHGSE